MMINLLPPEEKTSLSLEEKKRLIIIIWLLFLFFILCWAFILFSIKFYLQGQVEYQEIILEETEKRIGQSEVQDLWEKFDSFNSQLVQLNSFYQQKVYFSEALEKISEILPPEAYLTNISVTKKETELLQVSLSGFIPTREDLFKFKKNLEKEETIQEVSFPSSNWLEPVDIDFFVTFDLLKD